MVDAVQGEPYQAYLLGAETGLVGTIEVEVYDPDDGAVVTALSSAGITEPTEGTYRVERTAPDADPGLLGYEEFIIRWVLPDDDKAEEVLRVYASAADLPAPPGAPYSSLDVRGVSALLDERFPRPDPYVVVQDSLNQYVVMAQGLVAALTGRDVGGGPGTTSNGCPIVPPEPWQVGLALRALALETEALAVGGTAARRGQALTGQNLRSFTAGPYSESYFGPGEAASAKALSLDPATHEALWAIATECMRGYWTGLWTGVHPPGVGVMEVDWRRGRGRYPLRGRSRR